jgi:putative ABC transport system ATP-binding protein
MSHPVKHPKRRPGVQGPASKKDNQDNKDRKDCKDKLPACVPVVLGVLAVALVRRPVCTIHRFRHTGRSENEDSSDLFSYTVSMNSSVVNLDSVSKSYRLGKVEVPALRSVDLEIEKGEFTALAGPSGSGKTTLLNLIGCLDKPTQGRIFLEGRDVTRTSLDKLADLRGARLGFIFQTFNLLPILTAFENVEYPLLLSGVARKERHQRVWNWLGHVGLGSQATQRPDQLSGGQRQRVALARAMVTEPVLVLADEPTANLDSETAAQILDLLSSINCETGATFLFATHDAAIIRRARRRIGLHDGHIVSDQRNHQSQGVLHASQDCV